MYKSFLSVLMTMDHVRVGISNNLTRLKDIVPNELSANALVKNRWFKYIPLLMLAIISHDGTDEGYATLQYLLDQGANPDVSILGNVSWKNVPQHRSHFSTL